MGRGAGTVKKLETFWDWRWNVDWVGTSESFSSVDLGMIVDLMGRIQTRGQ